MRAPAGTNGARQRFVGQNGTDTVDVIDNITKTLVRNIDIDAPCSGQINGMAAGDIPMVGTRVYVVCDNNDVIIINPNDFTFTTIQVGATNADLGGVAGGHPRVRR